jgi:hypothetical protein
MLMTRKLIADVTIFLSMLKNLSVSEAAGAIVDPCGILSIEGFVHPTLSSSASGYISHGYLTIVLRHHLACTRCRQSSQA